MSQILYPAIQPFNTQWITTEDGHEIYVEQSGNIEGIPVIYLHGGPGGGSNANYRRYFNPEHYHIIQFDQRGCGLSKPSPSLHNNTVETLLSDMELIRQQLSIEQWLVCGGSWGTTLALLYGIQHSDRVLAFILRGIFLGKKSEYDWLYQPTGAAKFFPEYYQEFIEQLDEPQQNNPLQSYYEKLTSSNELAAIAASKAWYLWESRLSSIETLNLSNCMVENTHQAICMATISSHYFANNCFIEPNYIIDNIDKIAHLSAIVIHGRYDMVCQLAVATELTEHWQNAQLQIMPVAGHSGFEKQTAKAFTQASDDMYHFIKKQG